MKKLRVLVLMHDYLVPPEDASSRDLGTVDWKTEYDVTSTLQELGHDVRPLGVKDDLGTIRAAADRYNARILVIRPIHPPALDPVWRGEPQALATLGVHPLLEEGDARVFDWDRTGMVTPLPGEYPESRGAR